MTRRALCVGIDRFRSPDLQPLKGAQNDARTVATVLAREFGYDPGNIRLLLGENATKDAWLTAVDQLLARSVPGDELVVFTSSYGSQADDEQNDEADGLDEVLVTWDHDPYGNPLRDDEIAQHLNALRDGVSLAFVWDTCNAGTMDDGTRSLMGPTQLDGMPEHVARWAGKFLAPIERRDRSVEAPAAKKVAKKKNKGKKTDVQGPAARAVSFSACADGETAADGSFGGIPMGAFTFAFLDVLRRSREQLTWEELLKRTKATLKKLGFKQTPQLSTPESLRERPAFWGRLRRGNSAPRVVSSPISAPSAAQPPQAPRPAASTPAPTSEQQLHALEAAGRWSEVVTLLWQQVNSLGKTEDKVRVLQRIATIYRDVFHDERSALETLERVLALVPSDPAVLASLFAAYAKQGNFARISQLQQWLASLVTGKK